MFYFAWKYRADKVKNEDVGTLTHHTLLEVLWTAITVAAVMVFFYYGNTTMQMFRTMTAESQAIVIDVEGSKWKWKYEYLNEDGENVSYFSNLRTPQSEIYNAEDKGEHYLLEVDEPVVLPADTKVRFLITANDVIHSWWVPELAVKRDAIPGFINEAWTRTSVEGIYRGQCAELCGKDHGFMPIVVNVVSKEEYAEWLSAKQADAAQVKELMAQTFTLDELMTRGKAVYDRACMACHGANGEGGLGNAIAKSPVATGDLSKHLDIGINGVPGTAMQAFGGQMNDVDMAAVITYQRNAFGNNMGDTVQPIDVFNYKKG